jgi:hypothetical protein
MKASTSFAAAVGYAVFGSVTSENAALGGRAAESGRT